MTDGVYRASSQHCPECRELLRDHDSRLVCDSCHGMLLSLEDLQASIHEIDGGDAAIEVRDRLATNTPCPRCGSALETCTLTIGDALLGIGVRWCARDGAWMPRDMLVAAYANAGRRKHRRLQTFGTSAHSKNVLTGAPSGGRAGPPADAGMVAVIQSATNPFAHATLAISSWAGPRTHTVFVSAHRGHALKCSSCGDAPLQFAGDRWVCATCHGSFVEDAALVAMVEEMTGAPWQLPVPEGPVAARRCPVCNAAMHAEPIETVAIERCHGHGVWFARDALAGVLEHAGHPVEVGGWLHRLFHLGHGR